MSAYKPALVYIDMLMMIAPNFRVICKKAIEKFKALRCGMRQQARNAGGWLVGKRKLHGCIAAKNKMSNNDGNSSYNTTTTTTTTNNNKTMISETTSPPPPPSPPDTYRRILARRVAEGVPRISWILLI